MKSGHSKVPCLNAHELFWLLYWFSFIKVLHNKIKSFLNKNKKKFKETNLAYVGCYSNGGTYCNAFVENGLNITQCQSAASIFSVTCNECYYSHPVTSNAMTAELCLQVCSYYGFTYAGLSK